MMPRRFRTLITGHRGFVGRHMLAECRRRDHQLTCIDIADNAGALDARRYFRNNDARFDLVIHCAAVVGGRTMIDGSPLDLATEDLTLDGELFRWALRTRPARVVYFSSSAAYPVQWQTHGAALLGPLSEDMIDHHGDTLGRPDATYGLVKLVGERLALEAEAAGIPVTVLRPFSGYGRDQALDYPFPSFIARARRRADPFEVWGDGRQVRDFVHVDDVVAATFAAVDIGHSGPLNIGTGRPTSFDELAELVTTAAGYWPELEHHLGAPTGVEYRVADIRRLSEVYTPRISLEEGITLALAAAVPS